MFIKVEIANFDMIDTGHKTPVMSSHRNTEKGRKMLSVLTIRLRLR